MFKKIALYIKLAKLAMSSKEEMLKVMKENGWKSTRFWITVFTILMNIFAAVMGMLPAQTVAWIVFALTALYLILRTISKWTPTKVDDEIVAAIEDPLKKVGVDTAVAEMPKPPQAPVPGHQ